MQKVYNKFHHLILTYQNPKDGVLIIPRSEFRKLLQPYMSRYGTHRVGYDSYNTVHFQGKALNMDTLLKANDSLVSSY